MSLSVETLAVARKYTDDSLAGAGAVAGVPCKIQSITAITGGNRVTFLWTDNNGDDHTSAMDVMNGVDGEDGKGIQSVSVNAENHLIITYTDGTTVDAGQIEIHSAVDSVNGQTGAVVLDAEDVGALPDNTPIPSKTSDLTNDSGFATTSDVSTALADYTTTADLTTLLAAKQDTLTFDNAPTENSNNPVKSGGVYSANQTLTSAFVNNVNENGSKNILPNDVYSQTLANVSVSVNDNGEITVSGTANDTFKLYIHSFEDFLNDFLELNKDYVFSSGIPYNDTTANITLKIMQTSGGSWVFIGNGDTFKLTSTPYRIEVVWWASSGTVLSGTCKPMICLKSDYDIDPTYEPYSKTNRQLSQDSVTWDNLSEVGAVNMVPINLTTQVDGIYSYTVAADKTISAVVASTTSLTFKVISPIFTLKAGTYKLSGTPVMSGSTADLQLIYSDDSAVIATEANNQGGVFTLTTDTSVKLRIVWHSNVAAGTYVFKPMITVPSYNGSYVPYAKTNKELTEDTTGLLDNLEVNGAVNMLLSSFTDGVSKGVTLTNNTNGTLNVSGTNDGTGNGYFNGSSFKVPDSGLYKITGLPETVAGSSIMDLYLFNVTDNQNVSRYATYVQDYIYNLNSSKTYRAVISVYSGKTVPSGTIIKPMLSVASMNLSYGDYVPYAKSNKELTEDVTSLDAMYDGKAPSAVSDLNIPLTAGGATVALTRHLNNTTNAPTTGGGLEITWSSSDRYGAQLTLTDAGLYFRTNSSGTISAWQKIST